MGSTPSVLLLDDGELDRVHAMLKRIGADYLRLQGREIGKTVEAPRDLLISSGKRSLEMPAVEPHAGTPAGEPTWICIHNQDFLPLRERLGGLGVHYLVQNALDDESLRLFLLQLLHRGEERRAQPRLPLGGTVKCRLGAKIETARLAELSGETCRVFSVESIAAGTPVSVILPAALGGGSELELNGHSLRCAVCESKAGSIVFSTVVQLDGLDEGAAAQLDRIVRGLQIGTRVTPLAGPRSDDTGGLPVAPPAQGEPEAAEPAAPTASAQPVESIEPAAPVEPLEPVEPTGPSETADQRTRPRHVYDRQVSILDFNDADAGAAMLGRDLSLDGLRVAGSATLREGVKVTVALYGGRREEPVVVDATVARKARGGGAALRFDPLDAGQRRQIEKLLAGLPALESLGGEEARPDPIVVARVREAQT